MKLSACIVTELLKPFSVTTHINESKSFSFDNIQLLEESILPDSPSVLYIGKAELLKPTALAGTLEHICVVCIGTEDETALYTKKYHASLILVSPQVSLAAVVNALYIGFQNITNWAEELNAAVLSNEDYPAIFSIGGRFFGENPLLMVNSSYNVIGSNLSSLPNHERINFILKNGYYSKELTDGLAAMGYMAKGFHYMEPTILTPPNYMNCPLMVLSIHAANGIFLGFITVYFVNNDPTPAQFELFSYFARLVRTYYLANSEKGISTPTPFETFMEDLINHTQEDESFMRDRASTLRLPLEATYRLCVIQWEQFSLPQADYLRNRLRTTLKFPTYRVVLYHQSVLLLMQGNISSLKVLDEMNEYLGEFCELLKICQGYAGFSTANFPLMKLNIAYQQALTAARYGIMLSPEKRVYFYSHYYIYEMIDEYKNRYALEDMYIQKLQLLKNPSESRYDNLSLLRNYLLTERSISSTAKIMHMHRNSVIYRLGKIQEILGLDMDDPDVRLRMILSFKILELIKGRIDPFPDINDPGDSPLNFTE